MTRQSNRRLLMAIAGTTILLTGLYLLFEDVARDPVPPDDVAGMARWLAAHPADWLTASVLTDRALDSSLPRRFELWRAAHTLASHLAPARPNASAAAVRSGFFHWYELTEPDRRRVKKAIEPLLRDEVTFGQLAQPLWTLTRDFALLRRANPGTPGALSRLRELALAYGLFDDYRALRDDLRRARLAAYEAKPATDDVWMLLPTPITAADEPLLRRILETLRLQPPASGAGMSALIDYALRHHLAPLDGLTPLVRSPDLAPALRARLALRLGMVDVANELELAHAVNGADEWQPYFIERGALARLPNPDAPALAASGQIAALEQRFGQPREWRGTCGTDVCTSAWTYVWGGDKRAIRVQTVQSDEVAPYVEIYVDDRLAAEGEVQDAATFEIPLGAGGLHRVDLRLANPLTRNRMQRRVALG